MTTRNVYDVILHNEGEGTPLRYDVAAETPLDAIKEAWRQYRELPYVDGETPPAWARPIVQAALQRPNGESPWIETQGDWYHPTPSIVRNLSPKAKTLEWVKTNFNFVKVDA